MHRLFRGAISKQSPFISAPWERNVLVTAARPIFSSSLVARKEVPPRDFARKGPSPTSSRFSRGGRQETPQGPPHTNFDESVFSAPPQTSSQLTSQIRLASQLYRAERFKDGRVLHRVLGLLNDTIQLRMVTDLGPRDIVAVLQLVKLLGHHGKGLIIMEDILSWVNVYGSRSTHSDLLSIVFELLLLKEFSAVNQIFQGSLNEEGLLELASDASLEVGSRCVAYVAVLWSVYTTTKEARQLSFNWAHLVRKAHERIEKVTSFDQLHTVVSLNHLVLLLEVHQSILHSEERFSEEDRTLYRTSRQQLLTSVSSALDTSSDLPMHVVLRVAHCTVEELTLNDAWISLMSRIFQRERNDKTKAFSQFDNVVEVLRLCVKIPKESPFYAIINPPTAMGYLEECFKSDRYFIDDKVVSFEEYVLHFVKEADEVDVLTYVPQFMKESVLRLTSEYPQRFQEWLPSSVRLVLHYIKRHSMEVATQLYKQYWELVITPLLKQGPSEGSGAPLVVPPEVVGPLLEVEALMQSVKVEIGLLIKQSLPNWSVTQVLQCVELLVKVCHSTETSTDESTSRAPYDIVRSLSNLLCPYVARASPMQLAKLTYYIAQSEVREKSFCEAVVSRLKTFFGAPSQYRLDIYIVGGILTSLSSLEYKDTSYLVDAIPFLIHTLTTRREGNLEIVVKLFSCYSANLVWNYEIVSALSQRVVELVKNKKITLADFHHLLLFQVAVLRMDASQQKVTELVLEAATTLLNEGELSSLSLTDAVLVLSVLSRLNLRAMSEQTHLVSPDTAAPLKLDASVINALLATIMAQKDDLPLPILCEVVASLSRLQRAYNKGEEAVSGLLEGSLSPSPQEGLEALHLRVVSAMPTSTPSLIQIILEAYSLVGRGDTELFHIAADRVLACVEETSSLTLASILSSFARANVCHDQFFIEMIPRVRHVAQYGTSEDIVNVVTAYAKVNLWHYALFSQLADRAVSLKFEFSSTMMVELLAAYAKVGMRYTKLFDEFSVRIKALESVLTLEEVQSLMTSYAKVNLKNPVVFTTCTAQALLLVDQIDTVEKATTILDAMAEVEFDMPSLRKTLYKKFPDIEKHYQIFDDAEETVTE